MADRGVDLSGLPKEVRDQLAELDLELSEGKGSELKDEMGDVVTDLLQRSMLFTDTAAAVYVQVFQGRDGIQ